MNIVFVYALLIATSSFLHPMDDRERKERVIDGLEILKGEADYPLYSPYVTELNWGSFTFTPIKARFTCAAFHPDGTTLAYGYYDRHAKNNNPPCFYDLPRKHESAQPLPSKGVTTSMTFSPNGHLFAFGNKINNEESLLTLYTAIKRDTVPYSWAMWKPTQCASPLLCMQFSPDNKTLALASHDGAVRLWDVATNKCVSTLREESIEPTHAVAYTDNNQVCFNGTRGCITLMDTRSPSVTFVTVHSDIVRTISANLTRRLIVSGSYDGNVRFADLRKVNKDLVRGSSLNKSPVMSVAMHPHYAECIAGHRNGKVYLYDTTGNYVTMEGPNHKARVTAVTLSATRDYWAASVSYDGQLKLYNTSQRVLALAEPEKDKKQAAEDAASEDDKPQCSVCLEGYASDEVDNMKVALKCEHEFHSKCITKWLASEDHDSSCPLCRQKHDGSLKIASKK